MRPRAAGGLVLRVVIVLAVAGALVLLSIPRGEGPASVDILGHTEPVFTWSRNACEEIDIPDAPARAFRNASGHVQLIAASYVNRRMIGPDLNTLRQSCRVIMESDFNPNPAAFNDHEWIAATYTPDGKTVYALVHDEYQGNQHPGRCPANEYEPCWFNSITYAVSRDGGRTYVQPPEPMQLVATVPYTYDPGAGPYGIFQPSNIVRKDGYFYALVRAEQYKAQKPGVCVMRTRELSRPDSWRAWDGGNFSVQFVNPYSSRRPTDTDERHLCEPVDRADIGGMTQSLTYSTYFRRFILVGVMAAPDLESGGVYFSLSDNLLEWTRPRLIMRAELVFTFKCGDQNPIAHPSLIDPNSKSRNFETVGREPYLFYTLTRYDHCRQTLNRDLLRVRVRFSK